MKNNLSDLNLSFDIPLEQNCTITPSEIETKNYTITPGEMEVGFPILNIDATEKIKSPWPDCTITPLTHGSPSWLAARRLGITASDIPIIMGVSHYSTPYQLWLDKRDGTESKSTRQMEYGLHLEPLLVGWFNEDIADKANGRYCYLVNWHMCRNDEPAFMATIDCTYWENETNPAIVELKTAVGVNDSQWEEENIPPAYYYQVQWQLYVTGAPKAYLACLPAGNANRFMVREVERDAMLQASMVKAAEQFLYMLKNGIAPVAMAEDLSKLPLSETEAEKYEPSEHFMDACRQYSALAIKMSKMTFGKSELEKELKDLKAQMAQMMGSKSNCTINEAGKIITITRKLIKVKAKQVAASSYQKIDIKEG